jgi:ADP-heptose:LPS heptosyltransferase
VINLTEGDRGALAARLSGASVRVGFDPKSKGFFGKKEIYTHVVKHCPGLRHTVERNLDAVRRMGIFPRLEDRQLLIHIPDESFRSAQSLVGGESFVLIHPSSRWRFKCWPIQQMRELVLLLLARGERVVFTSGPDPIELDMVEQIVQGTRALNLGGKVSLKELAALIKQTKALICVDSVPLHLASALKTPVLALFGPTSDVTWGPWQNPQARVVAKSMSCRPCYQDGCGGSKVSDCLQQLSVSQVLAAFDALMNIPNEEICLKS